MLGRFLHSLNKFCKEEYGLHFDIPDYSVYEFAKVCAAIVLCAVLCCAKPCAWSQCQLAHPSAGGHSLKL